MDPSVYFTNDAYGLLNAAKFASAQIPGINGTLSTNMLLGSRQHPSSASFELSYDEATGTFEIFHPNSSQAAVEIVTSYPSAYSQWEVIILALIMVAMMVVIVVGNMLVVIAIATENNLTSVQNWFIASLAVADMTIGLVIMPFSLGYELMGYWMFGPIWCEIHAALDVFVCTSSIMNICLISLDRYWSITKAIDYLNSRTPARVTVMIMLVWLLSGLVSIPPLLGWKKKGPDMTWFHDLLDEQGNRTQTEFINYLEASGKMDLSNFTATLETVVYPQCGLSQDFGYVLYSAFGSFYIPSCIMVFVYIKIYFAARERARRHVKAKQQRKSRKRSNRLGQNGSNRINGNNNNNINTSTLQNHYQPQQQLQSANNYNQSAPLETGEASPSVLPDPASTIGNGGNNISCDFSTSDNKSIAPPTPLSLNNENGNSKVEPQQAVINKNGEQKQNSSSSSCSKHPIQHLGLGETTTSTDKKQSDQQSAVVNKDDPSTPKPAPLHSALKKANSEATNSSGPGTSEIKRTRFTFDDVQDGQNHTTAHQQQQKETQQQPDHQQNLQQQTKKSDPQLEMEENNKAANEGTKKNNTKRLDEINKGSDNDHRKENKEQQPPQLEQDQLQHKDIGHKDEESKPLNPPEASAAATTDQNNLTENKENESAEPPKPTPSLMKPSLRPGGKFYSTTRKMMTILSAVTLTVETPKKDKTDEDDLDDLTSTSSSEEDSEDDYDGDKQGDLRVTEFKGENAYGNGDVKGLLPNNNKNENVFENGEVVKPLPDMADLACSVQGPTLQENPLDNYLTTNKPTILQFKESEMTTNNDQKTTPKTSLPPHPYGACHGPKMRRSIGVSTRADDDCDDSTDTPTLNHLQQSSNNQEATYSHKRRNSSDVSNNSDKARGCIKLRSRLRGPTSCANSMNLNVTNGGLRRPSKETREMMDNGRSWSRIKKFQNGGTEIVHRHHHHKHPNHVEDGLADGSSKSVILRFPSVKFCKKKGRNLTQRGSSSKSADQGIPMNANENNAFSRAGTLAHSTRSSSQQQHDVEKEKKRVARKKERRATLILGLIMGSFIACWFPFFFLYSISPVCPICEEQPDSPCCIRGWGFSLAFWLGYSNSALNPVIYTVFNKDFRRAFKRILFK